MADHFDPYYKWLGISPQNQPPDLYRLLSLERFETDPEVIEAAANRQMIYIQSCATGPYVEHSQKLLNEISAARLCLLDVKRKAQYDASLRAKLSPVPPPIAGNDDLPRVADDTLTDTVSGIDSPLGGLEDTIVAVKRPQPPPAPARAKPGRPAAASSAAGSDVVSRPKAHLAARKRGSPVGVLLVVGGLAVVVIGAGAYILMMSHGDESALGGVTRTQALLQPTQAQGPVSPKAELGADLSPLPTLQGTGQLVDPPAPATPPSPSPSDDLYQQGLKALERRELNGATEALTKVADDGRNAKRSEAVELLRQINTLTSNDWGRRELLRLDDQRFELYKQGRLVFDFPDIHPALINVARETLQRVLPEVQQERAASKGAAPNPGPMGQPAAAQQKPAAAAEDPVEYLTAKGLKRVWKTWILQDEAKCLEQIAAGKEAEKRHNSAKKEQLAAKKKVEAARRGVERDEAALKRAEESGKPASGTPEHDKLADRATQSRGALETAELEATGAKEEMDRAAKEAIDALAEVRRLAANIDEQYRPLAADPQVKQALEELGQELGPSEEFNAVRAELNRGKRRNAD